MALLYGITVGHALARDGRAVICARNTVPKGIGLKERRATVNTAAGFGSYGRDKIGACMPEL